MCRFSAWYVFVACGYAFCVCPHVLVEMLLQHKCLAPQLQTTKNDGTHDHLAPPPHLAPTHHVHIPTPPSTPPTQIAERYGSRKFVALHLRTESDWVTFCTGSPTVIDNRFRCFMDDEEVGRFLQHTAQLPQYVMMCAGCIVVVMLGNHKDVL